MDFARKALVTFAHQHVRGYITIFGVVRIRAVTTSNLGVRRSGGGWRPQLTLESDFDFADVSSQLRIVGPQGRMGCQEAAGGAQRCPMVVDSPGSTEQKQQCGDARGILGACSHVELQEGQDAVGIYVQSGAGIMEGFDGWRGPAHQQAVNRMADGAHIVAMATQSIDQSDARATDPPFGQAVCGRAGCPADGGRYAVDHPLSGS